jgi:glutamine synthetase
MHGGDRNRTSPFAFTGNKFEFRALGSSQSLSLPNTVLNTIVAEALDALSDDLEKAVEGGSSLEEAVPAIVKDSWSANKRVVFEGDNYTDEWHTEAEGRGLENLRTTVDALPWLVEGQTVGVFSDYGVLSERELHSRYDVFVEQYLVKVNIEAETAAAIARTMLLPAAVRHLELLKAADVEPLVEETDGLVAEFVDAIKALEAANATHEGEEGSLDHAAYMRDTVLPAMDAVRDVADRLEKVVADDLWPLPKYEEMLFIK